MTITYKTEYWNERRNNMQTDVFTFKDEDVARVLNEIASDFNAPRKNGFIPDMIVGVDEDGNITITIRQELSDHMKKKLGL